MDWMDLFELESAFESTFNATAPLKTTPVDLVCFDACQDASIELAAVLRPYGRLMVANQSGTPILEGWPFDVWPKVLNPNTFLDDAAVARHFVDSYAQIARSRNVISVMALSGVEKVLQTLGELSSILLSDWTACGPVLNEAASPAACPSVPNSYADKRDMVKLVSNLRDGAIKRGGNFRQLADAAAAVVDAVTEIIVDCSTCADSRKYGYNGISIYLPDGTMPMSPYAATIYSPETPDFGGFKAMTRWHDVVSQFAQSRPR